MLLILCEEHVYGFPQRCRNLKGTQTTDRRLSQAFVPSALLLVYEVRELILRMGRENPRWVWGSKTRSALD